MMRASLCQVQNSFDNVFSGRHLPHSLPRLKRVLGIILVHWGVHDAGGYGVEPEQAYNFNPLCASFAGIISKVSLLIVEWTTIQSRP
jgi:hypothetical protein